MLDFFVVSKRMAKGCLEVYPKFLVKKSKDLMIRGNNFYAMWNEESNLWTTSEFEAISIIDSQLDEYVKTQYPNSAEGIRVLHMWDAESGMIDIWHKYVQKQMPDNFHQLDEKLIFSNSNAKKTDYASRMLSYPLEPGSIENYDKLMTVLYSEEERHKLEWAIGSVVAGDSKDLQKFIVLYGSPGSGKSTVLNIVQDLFDGYCCVFDAKALGSSSNSFALEAFRSNPLVAIQHDGDLSRIEDNTRLNSLVSHENMLVNEKFRSVYSNRFNCLLFMGTNKPVKISDAKSGILRRLIDVTPTGEKIPVKDYRILTKQIKFELGAIASYCLSVYEADPGYYDTYIPVNMMSASNDFYNFVMDSFDVFKEDDSVTLKVAWEMYKNYCDDAKVPYTYSKRVFKEELKNYFKDFEERGYDENGSRIRNLYSGFLDSKFENKPVEKKAVPKVPDWLDFSSTSSILDDIFADFPAQYANENETPMNSWAEVKTKLRDIDTSRLHYVNIPEKFIVIDFDLKDKNGEKSLERNIEAASLWPKTYAELSKSGKGIHLHYIYDGDPKLLSRLYAEGIEIKVFNGDSSLRRKVIFCNTLAMATISTGLPLQEAKKVLDSKQVHSERKLRELISRNLRKETHPSTTQSINFIKKILDDAYDSGLVYDVSDMEHDIYVFASCSTHQSTYCLSQVPLMKLKSKEPPKGEIEAVDDLSKIVFFDVEVFKNLFVICYKMRGPGHKLVKLINPDHSFVNDIFAMMLVGFNNRDYDNHILYGWMLGYNNYELYCLSQRIIGNEPGSKFGAAYDISFTDIFDFCSKKQSLKKWEIELGIHHHELGLHWDEEVPEELWETVAEYCGDDVIATEAVFEARYEDFEARLMLASIANMEAPSKPNDTTNSLSAKFIFGTNRNPQSEFVYTKLWEDERFKDYIFFSREQVFHNKDVDPDWLNEAIRRHEGEDRKYSSFYRGEAIGEGGYVYSEPGMYRKVKVFDVESEHPNSMIQLNLFGDRYTLRFKEILNLRIAIKHKDFDKAKKMLNGVLAPFLDDPSKAKALAAALKIVINSIYGLTSAGFSNPFRDPRNIDNIVAKRGELFMINLKLEVQKRGFQVVHIKTDSIKVVDPTPEIEQFIIDFGKSYGYNFAVEDVYERFCLVNDAVYIAKCDQSDPSHPGEWTATGAQFAQNFVFKTLFSKEELEFRDYCETKAVNTALYLDMNEPLEDVSIFEKTLEKAERDFFKGKISEIQLNGIRMELTEKIAKGHDYRFVGKVGSFCPVKPGCGGGILLRFKDEKYYSVSGAKGYRWLESETLAKMDWKSMLDMSYYQNLIDDAVNNISKYGDFEGFCA